MVLCRHVLTKRCYVMYFSLPKRHYTDKFFSSQTGTIFTCCFGISKTALHLHGFAKIVLGPSQTSWENNKDNDDKRLFCSHVVHLSIDSSNFVTALTWLTLVHTLWPLPATSSTRTTLILLLPHLYQSLDNRKSRNNQRNKRIPQNFCLQLWNTARNPANSANHIY